MFLGHDPFAVLAFGMHLILVHSMLEDFIPSYCFGS